MSTEREKKAMVRMIFWPCESGDHAHCDGARFMTGPQPPTKLVCACPVCNHDPDMIVVKGRV